MTEVEDATDHRSAQERLMAMMAATCVWKDRTQARLAARGLFYDSLRLSEPIQGDLMKAYCAEDPHLYWSEWLSEPLELEHFVRLIAIHLAAQIDFGHRLQFFESRRAELRRELSQWTGVNKTDPCLLTLDPMETIVWLSVLRQHMIPNSLAAWLDKKQDISRAAASAHLPVINIGEKPVAKGRGGRKPKYDWPSLDATLAAKLYEDGLPTPNSGEQAKLERWAMEQFPPDQQPVESEIRAHVVAAISARTEADKKA